MSNVPAAISGTYADFKLVKTRSVAQIVVEVPIERAETIIAAFGFPVPGSEIHLAVARIKPEATKGVHSAGTPTKPKQQWREMKASQQAGMLCNDPDFQDWICEVWPPPPGWNGAISEQPAENTAELVRLHCGVQSRSDLDHPSLSQDAWRTLASEFFAWKNEPPIEAYEGQVR